MIGIVVLLVLSVGLISASTELAGAIIARGVAVVESNVKKVQHATGGIVGELLVTEGAAVEAGDLLVRLDDTIAKANVAAITKTLWELTARRSRLEAERDGAAAPEFPRDLLDAAKDAEIDRIVVGERRLLELRRTALQGQKDQLKERIGQLREEISGLIEQSAAKKDEIALIEQELVGLKELRQRDLVPSSRVMALERDATRLKGERGRLIATMAQTKGKISETELQILQLDQDLRSEVAKELADIRAKVAELVEKKVAALDQLQRIDIRAPTRGLVHQLSVHTKGGVVAAGEQIMLIVPDRDSLVIEAQIAANDIDRVSLGQPAVIRFTSLDQRTTPEVEGNVVRIAADAVQDAKSTVSYFPIRISMAPDVASRLHGARLVPGMPADIFIRTSERTILTYILKPLMDQSRLAFRER